MRKRAMRFSPGLSAALAAHLLKSFLRGEGKAPLVLMLEPTHRCNLACAGCDRVRLDSMERLPDLSLEECLNAARESGAPVVTITGGEPLLYGKLDELVDGLIGLGRYIYLCTNGLLARSFVERRTPHPHLTLSFHVDGMEERHDRITGRPGSLGKALEGIEAAADKGFRVWTNTSLYRGTDEAELLQLFRLLKKLGVEGILLSPAFGYESVGEDIFLSREEAAGMFSRMRPHLAEFPVTGTPLYLDFLEGKAEMCCMPWGSPTRNPLGWKSPCYLITDGYYRSFTELMEKTPWHAYGSGKDRRCRDCMVHSGFEPAAIWGSVTNPGKMLRMMWWNMRGRR